MKILIAEDDALYRHVLEAKLKEDGYEIIVCRNGAEAWKELQAPDPPRLAILDWVMPEMEGVAVCRKVRSMLKEPYVYIIMLTSKGDSKDIVGGLEAGADDYLIKPFEPHELSARLRSGRRIVDLQAECKRHETDLKNRNDELAAALGKLQRVQSLLIRQEKLASIGVLSAGIAHEIRNPLNIISTSFQLLMMEETISQETREAYQTIIEQVDRAAKITENLRDFARERKPEIKEIALHEFLDKTLALVEYEMTAENLKIEKKYYQEPIVFWGDQDQLAQVFLNMIGNARDSMNEIQKQHPFEELQKKGWEGRLTVETGISGSILFIRFKDTGRGLTEDIKKKVFDSFLHNQEGRQGDRTGPLYSLWNYRGPRRDHKARKPAWPGSRVYGLPSF